MDFLQAIKQAFAGDNVAMQGQHPEVFASVQGRRMIWSDGSAVQITDAAMQSNWQTVSPVQRYTFTEAYERMKLGKKMIPVRQKVRPHDYNTIVGGRLRFCLTKEEIDDLWEEVSI